MQIANSWNFYNAYLLFDYPFCPFVRTLKKIYVCPGVCDTYWANAFLGTMCMWIGRSLVSWVFILYVCHLFAKKEIIFSNFRYTRISVTLINLSDIHAVWLGIIYHKISSDKAIYLHLSEKQALRYFLCNTQYVVSVTNRKCNCINFWFDKIAPLSTPATVY